MLLILENWLLGFTWNQTDGFGGILPVCMNCMNKMFSHCPVLHFSVCLTIELFMRTSEWNQYCLATVCLCVYIHYYRCPPKRKRDEANVLWAMLFFPYTFQSASILLGCGCVLSRGEGQLSGTDCGFPWISCFSGSGRYLLSILPCATSLGPEVWTVKPVWVTPHAGATLIAVISFKIIGVCFTRKYYFTNLTFNSVCYLLFLCN